MKRYIPALLLCLLCGCAAEGDASPAPEREFPVTDDLSAAFEEASEMSVSETSAADETTAETSAETLDEPTQEPASEQERLELLILETRGTEPISDFSELAYPPENYAVFPMLFGDFDGCGQEELFAVYGCQSGYADAAAGEVWFACGETAKMLDSEPMPLWDIGAFRVLDEENALIAYSYLAATYRTDRIWQVSVGDVHKTEIYGFAGMDFEPCEYGGFTAKNSTYDAVYGCGGHTWKPYWHYYDAANNTMVQFDAREITPERLREYSGGTEALDGILSDEQNEIQNILLFDNGVICINYTHETYENLFRSYDAAGGELKDITPEENYGIYLSRFPEESGE